MNIGQYTFQEFKDRAAAFHGYPAPGLLIGGYMVEMAKAALPAGILFEAVVESKKCLPDAVQLLTLCSTGNNWMKIVNLGRYAVVVLDLAGVPAVDSSGVGALVRLQTALATKGRRLILANPVQAVADELRLRDLAGFFLLSWHLSPDMQREELLLASDI